MHKSANPLVQDEGHTLAGIAGERKCWLLNGLNVIGQS